MFEVGDFLIYPTQGLAEVKGIETKVIGGNAANFYILHIVSKNLAIMVPIANQEKIGLRKIVDPDDLSKVKEILSKKADSHYSQWHHRYGDNFDKLKSGSIFQTAEVVRDLMELKKRKNLAIKETRMMDNALQLLRSEISATMNIAEGEAEKWIFESLEEHGAALES